MTVRPFDWRDLTALHRYRDQGLFLDSTRLLTQGPKLVPIWAMFSQFASATGVFTYQSKSDGFHEKLFGQVIHTAGSTAARLAFIAPASIIDSPALPELIERLTAEIGSRGAMHLIAEVDELDSAFTALRQSGFAIYARQRHWRLNGEPIGSDYGGSWLKGRPGELINVRSLYCNLVPGLVQQVETPPTRRLPGLVYRYRGEVLGYAEVKSGPLGIWIQPFLHPDLDQIPGRLVSLVASLPSRRSRPVYFCVRSYQGWLEPALEDMGTEPGQRQAVLVRHLAIAKRATRTYRLPSIERGHPEVTAPMLRRIDRKL